MLIKTPKILEQVLNRFGYAPIRDTSQIMPDLAENLQWEAKPAKTVDYLSTYESAIWTYAAVFRIATTGAKVPFKIYKRRATKNSKRVEVSDKLVNYVLEIPNPFTTRFNLWESTLAFAELTGNSYWELVSEGDNPPEEIYVLRPDHMEIKPSRKNLIDHYVFNVNGRDIRLLPEDVLHFKYFSSKSELYGTSANTAAEKSIVLDLYSLDFNARFFKAGARIMGVLETDRHLSDKAMKRLNAKWIGKYGGYQKAFKTPVLEEGLKYKGITSSHTDMEFIAQRKMTREEILAAYGVPPAIVGLFEYANYCVFRGSKVLLADGRQIEVQDLKSDQEILNFNIEEKQFEKHRILNVFPRPRRKIYELKTGNRTIKVTDNHPFLTLLSGINPAYPRKIAWKKLKDLQKGDLIAILTEAPDWMGEGNNHLPDGTKATKDLMEQLGVYIGDGNCCFQHGKNPAKEQDKKVGDRGNYICIALPKKDPNREYYVQQAKRVWEYARDFKNKSMHIGEDNVCFRVYSTKVVKQIYDWGLNRTARKKRIPDWIFKLDKNLKKAFLKGYFDSDGSYAKQRKADGSIKTIIRIGASNEILVKQIRDICIQVGYPATNINEQHRITNYGQNDIWKFIISNFGEEKFVDYNSKKVHSKTGCQIGSRRDPLLKLSQGLNWTRVRSIKEIGEGITYDLEIEGVHNFICENILVANSNSHEQKRLFWEDTMIPKLMKLQEYVTAFLLPRYGSRLVGEFDLSTVQAIQESEEVKAKTATSLVDSGIMTRDEARDIYYQLDKVPGGDKITIRGKYVTIDDDLPDDDVSPDNINPDDKSPDDVSPDDENPDDGENPSDDENFDFSKTELKDMVVSLRKRLTKRIKESR